MFYFGFTEKEDWFYTPTFGVYQRVNNDVYCYVSRYFGFYTLQMYKRGTTGLCTLEARSKTNMEALFSLGEEWLRKFGEWDENEIAKNCHYIGQKNWEKDCWL